MWGLARCGYVGLWVQTGGEVVAEGGGQPVAAVKAKEQAAAQARGTEAGMLASATRKKLNERIRNADLGNLLTLKELLEYLQSQNDFPRIVVNQGAIKEENPDAPDIYETVIALPRLNGQTAVGGLSNGKVLRLALDQVPFGGAAYLIRPGYIEVTTPDRTQPAKQFIDADFQNVPLEKVLAELSDRSGITIIMDVRAGDKAKTPVTARFQPETNLMTAVGVLADMCDLKLMVLDQILYVTLKTNTAAFPPGNFPGRPLRVDAA